MGYIEKTVFISYHRTNAPWAQQDIDFENLRDNPRFKELVGE